MLAHAPYAFAPFPEHVYEPRWAKLVSHDVPFADGLSGEIEFGIETRTPLLIGGRRTKRQDESSDVYPVVTPDGKCVIPGSTLQGMIRSVIELIGSGRARFVENKRFGLRDPRPNVRHLYLKRVLNSIKARDGVWDVTILVRMGWLRLDTSAKDRRIVIEPCKSARVSFDELAAYAALRSWPRDADVEGRYRRWAGSGKSLDVDMVVDPITPHPHRGRSLRIPYQRAHFPAGSGAPTKKGRLVFTGPMERKHQEFFFFDPLGHELDVPDSVFETFRDIHEPSDGRDHNPTWVYFRDDFWAGAPIPVFWVPDKKGKVADFGLAFLPKLPFARSTRQMLTGAHDAGPDMATLIFGDVGGSASELRRRASLDAAVFEGVDPDDLEQFPPQILLGPRPSYYANYVQQPHNEGAERINGDFHATYTPHAVAGADNLVKEPKLAGAKRYPARYEENPTGVNSELIDKKQLHVHLRAIPARAKARSVLRFHNLRPIELGALIWALTWGGETWLQENEERPLRHSVGMGKPFGLGQIELRILKVRVRANVPANEDEIVADAAEVQKRLDGWMNAFEAEMDAFLRSNGGSWAAFDTVRALLAMADPSKVDGRTLEYMTLEQHGRVKATGGYLPLYPRRAPQRARKSAS